MSMFSVRVALSIALTLGSALVCAHAKPIAFADGTTVMGEYGAGTMTEIQAFYAPTFRYSVGGGHLSLNSSENDDTRDITYLRLNYLPKRWNLEAAQANVFVWGSIGRAHIGETGDNQFAWNVGGQVDYETRRIYGSLRTELHEASAYSHRIDTFSSASLRTSTTMRRSRCGSSCRLVTTPAGCSQALNGRPSFDSSRTTHGSKPERPSMGSFRRCSCSISDRGAKT